MSFRHHVTLTFGKTDEIVEFYPPSSVVLANGAPTAAAQYRVWNGIQGADETPKIGPSNATLDTVSTTVSVVSGYSQSNRKKLYLTSTNGVLRGRRYLLSNAEGQREICIPSLISTTYIEVEEALQFDYAITTSTFIGLRQSFTIDSTFIQDIANINVYGVTALLSQRGSNESQAPPFRVEWRFTAGSQTFRILTSFDVARYPAQDNLSIDDLRELIPDVHLHEWLDQRGQDYSPQLRAARRDLEIDVRGAGYDPDGIQDPQIYQRLLLQKWAVVIGKGMLFAQPEVNSWLETTVDDYAKMFEKLVGTAFRAWYAPSSTGATQPDSPTQLWLKGR